MQKTIRYIKEHRIDNQSDYLFSWAGCQGACTTDGLYNRWRRFCERLDLYHADGSNITFHNFRHTNITKLAGSMTPFQLARHAGHSNVQVTMGYVKFNDTIQKEAFDKSKDVIDLCSI